MPPTLNREKMVLVLSIRRASGSRRAAKFKACRKFSLNVGLRHRQSENASKVFRPRYPRGT